MMIFIPIPTNFMFSWKVSKEGITMCKLSILARMWIDVLRAAAPQETRYLGPFSSGSLAGLWERLA